jgi:hypothetical protein
MKKKAQWQVHFLNVGPAPLGATHELFLRQREIRIPVHLPVFDTVHRVLQTHVRQLGAAVHGRAIQQADEHVLQD